MHFIGVLACILFVEKYVGLLFKMIEMRVGSKISKKQQRENHDKMKLKFNFCIK